jgi:hypothetical protein
MPMAVGLGSSLIIISLAVGGCSSIELQSAQTLAAVGEKTATMLGDSAKAPADWLNTYLDGEYLLSGLEPGYSPPSESMLSAVESVKESFVSRAFIFNEISNAYSAFFQLASYNASKDMEDSLDELSGAINAFSKHVLSSTYPVISDAASGVISSIRGVVRQEIQKRRVKKASEEIRKRLQVIAELMKKDAERRAVISVNKEIARNSYKIMAFLSRIGALDAMSILRTFAAKYDLELTKGEVTPASNSAINAAIHLMLIGKNRRAEIATQKHYDASVALVQKLISQHDQLEKGEPMDLGSVRERIMHVRMALENLYMNRQAR